jgi:hypothetical protein
VAKPERAVLGRAGQDAGSGGGELDQGGHPLGAAAEAMTPEDLLDAGGRQPYPAVGQVVDQALGADRGSATASASTASTWSGGVAVGITGGRRSLGSSAASP